jgi:membrane protease subunit HflK
MAADHKEPSGQGPWGQKPPQNNNVGGHKGGGNDGGGRKPNQPPDLEEMLRQAQNKMNSVFGRQPSAGQSSAGIGLVVLLALAVWLGTGFYRVAPEENAVLLTFGKYTGTRVESGLGYHIPWPVQTVMKVNVAFDRRVIIGADTQEARGGDVTASHMLTGDENIVDIGFAVTWRIGSARDFLFQIRDPENTVKKVAESAMREIIGRSVIQKVLTEGRADIEIRTKELMQKMLDDYKSGISINSVQLLGVNPPAQVVDAFDDVQRARADKERVKNEAETYRNNIVPVARGEAQKLLQDAEAYKAAVMSKAKGDADRFNSVYDAYAQSKDVTTKRIYIETMQQIMQNSKKVVVGDSNKGAPVMPYMSLDQLQSAKSK